MTPSYELKTSTPEQPSWLVRIWNFLKEQVEAMDYGPYDYFNDRLIRVENEVLELRKEKTLDNRGSE